MALLGLIPVKDWIYGLLIAGLIAFGVYEVHHLKAEGAAKEVAALQVSSDKLQAAAAKQVAATAASYSATLSTVTENLDAQVKAAATQHTADALRLQNFDAYRRSHPQVGSPGGGPSAQSPGTSVAAGTSDYLTSLGQVALSFAGANADAASALSACMADRDALTGK